MVKGSWFPRGTGWPLSLVSWVYSGAQGTCTGEAPGGRPGARGVWVLVPWGQGGPGEELTNPAGGTAVLWGTHTGPRDGVAPLSWTALAWLGAVGSERPGRAAW